MGTNAGLDRVRLPAAVSPLVAAELAGEPRRRRVLAAFPSCLYVELGAHERVLAVLASDALLLPIGVRLAVPSAEVQWGVEPGGHVVVGEGRVRLPQADVVAVRPLRPGRVLPSAVGIGAAAAPDWSALPDPGLLGDLAHDLAAAALAGGSADPGVRGLVGVGHGLTPSGDDALCGVLLALSAVESPEARRALAAVRTVVRSVLPRTTSLSAALLVAAGDGYAVPAVARLVTLLVGAGYAAPGVSRPATLAAAAGPTGRMEGPKPVLEPGSAGSIRSVGPSLRDWGHGKAADVVEDPATSRVTSRVTELVERVLAIGHTSGRDLLAGVSGALRAVHHHASTTREGVHRA